MEFWRSLQLLTHYSPFRNVPCSTNHILTVEANRISVALNIFGFSWTIVLDVLNAFWQDRPDRLLVLFTKLSFTLFIVRCFFLLIHFLVVEDYELPKSTGHVLSVPSTLEYVRILSWFISLFFYFSCLPGDVLRKISIWANDTAFNLSYGKPSQTCRNKLRSVMSYDKLWVVICP